MAFNTDNGMVMPVSPMFGGGGGFGGGFGNGFDSDIWLILIILFALFGNGFGGFGGGFGGGGAIAAEGSMLYPWMNQAEITQNGFRDQMLNTSIQGIQNSVTSGFGDVQLGIAGVNQNICQTGNSIVSAVNGAQNAITAQMYGNTIADLERSFASQTATTNGMNSIGMSLQNCCCENRANIADLKYTVATENCADRAAISDGIRDILAATQNQTQTILNQLCADKIEQKNDTIAQLRSELLYARGQASQDVQTALIQAGQRSLANEVEQYVAPRAIPAYTVQNPNCCYNNGCGCGGNF